MSNKSHQVWVIDDDKSIRWVLEKALTKAGMQVTSFSSANGVMEALERSQPEALMTDVGFTGGGAGSGMVYLAGKQDHKMDNAGMVDHIVELVEKRAAELEAERAAEAATATE